MRGTSKQKELERMAFADRAAACFSKDDNLATYTEIRWTPTP